ncbi:type II toxin-antitoxin system HicB family antitoxin [Candidatus Poribacteria bacterium]|nr:type II toxin-antitoxin system HicB family antitoxin [Candidatus Poribacteria bacterium]
MNENVFDGFAVKVFLDEDGDYLAHFVEMPNVSAFANTPEDALKERAVAWQGVKESYRKHSELIPQASLLRTEGNSLNIPEESQHESQ